VVRDVANQICLALLLCANIVAVLAHVWLGTGSLFTGIYLAIVTGFLILFGRWRSLVFADLLWLSLCGLFGLSAIQHPPAVPEAALFTLALAAYAVSRGLPGAMQKRSFLLILVMMVALGTILTLFAFNSEASKVHGRPLIFGQYDHPLVVFALLLGLLLFAFACSAIKIGLVAPICVVPIAIFAAAQVRFVFIALLGALVLGAIIAPPEQRRRFAAIVGLVALSVLGGALFKLDSTVMYAKYAVESLQPQQDPVPAVGCALVNLNNSLDIRRHVYIEALAELPEAGVTGIGLGRFEKRSCVSSQVHNTILQAAVELGIPASLVLVSLIVVIWTRLYSSARQGRQALFALCFLTFALLLSMVYGTLSSAGFLFVALGYGVAASAAREISQFDLVPISQTGSMS